MLSLCFGVSVLFFLGFFSYLLICGFATELVAGAGAGAGMSAMKGAFCGHQDWW
jgi:hypothetical protein